MNVQPDNLRLHAVSEPEQALTTRAEMTETLAVALRAGQVMLENGANTARVEETVQHIAMALGADSCDVYVTPTGIIATIGSDGDYRTRIQRVMRSGVDLSRVVAILDVSRQAADRSLARADVCERIERIASQPRTYGLALTGISVGLACGCTTMLFGGGVWEFAATFVAALLAFLLRAPLLQIPLSRPLLTACTAFVAALTAYSLALVWRISLPAQAITASVVFLVPGLVMISSVVDLFRGEIVAGMARLTSAILTLVAIAGGLWAMLLITGAQFGLQPGRPALPFAMALALCSAAGFGVLFDVPLRALCVAALIGAAAYGINRFCLTLGMPIGAAGFLAGLVISLLAELLARPLRLPTTVFTSPAFLPLVPGAAAFRTLLDFVGEDYMTGTASLVRTIIIVVALAAGIGAGGALVRVGRLRTARTVHA